MIRSHHEEKHGAEIFDDGPTSQDWDVIHDELGPHHARAEEMMGVSGKAGVIGGETVEGGNPHEGSRSGDYPLPAFERHAAGAVDLNATHLFDPDWRGHAKLHDAMSFITSMGLGGSALWLIWQPSAGAARSSPRPRSCRPGGGWR